MNSIDTTPRNMPSSAHTDARSAQPSTFQPCGCRYGADDFWYCVRTEFRAEYVALQALRLIFPTWFPEHELRLTNGQRKISMLFPRYGFVQFNRFTDQWRVICATRGVEWLFCSSPERPAPVPQAVMDRLFAMCAPNGVIYPDEALAVPVRTGDSVRVMAGPFRDFTGVCAMSSANRVKILLGALGAVSLPRESVEVVNVSA